MSARNTTPSSISIGASQSIFMWSRISWRNWFMQGLVGWGRGGGARSYLRGGRETKPPPRVPGYRVARMEPSGLAFGKPKDRLRGMRGKRRSGQAVPGFRFAPSGLRAACAAPRRAGAVHPCRHGTFRPAGHAVGCKKISWEEAHMRHATVASAILAALVTGASAQQLNDTQKLGQSLFVQSCGGCHLKPQLTSVQFAPVLSGESLGGQESVMREVIANGTPRMPGF